jgi:hypothetical protein
VSPPERPGTGAGAHRFVWDLRRPRPRTLGYDYSIAAVWPGHTPIVPEGPLVLPGRYTVSLDVDGRDYPQTLTVRMDPRVHLADGALEAQLGLLRQIGAALDTAVTIDSAMELALRRTVPSGRGDAQRIADLRTGTGGVHDVAGVLTSLFGAVEGADAPPTQGELAVFADYRGRLDDIAVRWRELAGGTGRP